MEIYFTEISEEETAETINLLKFVSEEKQNKLKRYRFPVDRKLSLYAEILVKQHAMYLLEIKNDEIEFERNKHGKPFLKGHTSFHFNISHTRNAMAVAFSNDEVGVDIEKVKLPEFQISKRFFTASEHDYILSHKNPDCAFYEVCTKKRSVYQVCRNRLS